LVGLSYLAGNVRDWARDRPHRLKNLARLLARMAAPAVLALAILSAGCLGTLSDLDTARQWTRRGNKPGTFLVKVRGDGNRIEVRIAGDGSRQAEDLHRVTRAPLLQEASVTPDAATPAEAPADPEAVTDAPIDPTVTPAEGPAE